jgi:type IV pilus biogenesis protein CpaD/CtpE
MMSRLSPLVVLVGALMLVGCRTYGDEGYGTEPKTYAAIQQTVQQMEQGLSRAESDLRRLQSAAASADTLEGLVDRYRELVESHETTLEQHRGQAEALSAESAYRTLHRIYGAMITDQRLLDRQYERTTRKVWATVRDTTLPRAPNRMESSYSITPVQYPRSERPEISMAEALRGLEGTPGLQPEEQAAGGE